MSLGCRIPFNFLASIATALFALCANASPITLNYTASLSFDPNATIAAGGINAGDPRTPISPSSTVPRLPANS